MITLDVGCGFTEGVQVPVYADVSLDLNMNKVEPPFLKKIKERDSHPICASATHLPFRSGIVEKIYWRAVLEHLPHYIAKQGIIEGVRVLKKGGEAEIILPIITAHMKHYIIILFAQFPFSLRVIQIALWRAHLYWHIGGVPHLTIIKPWDLEPYFDKVVWRADYYRHKWFHYPWGRVTRKFVNDRFISDMQGQYLVRCRK